MRKRKPNKQRYKQQPKDKTFIPLLDSNEEYFAQRREELNRELAESPTDFDNSLDEILFSQAIEESLAYKAENEELPLIIFCDLNTLN